MFVMKLVLKTCTKIVMNVSNIVMKAIMGLQTINVKNVHNNVEDALVL